MLYTGIDWSNTNNAVCILNKEKEIVKQFSVPNTAAGVLKLVQEIGDLSNPIGIETTNNFIARYLIETGHTVSNIPPLCVKRYGERLNVSGKKDDPHDARTIALMMCENGKHFPPSADSGDSGQIRRYCEIQDDLVRNRTRLVNRLRSLLLGYFPAFVQCFPRFDSATPFKVLLALDCNPNQALDLGPDGLDAKTAEIKSIQRKTREKCRSLLSENTVRMDDRFAETQALKARFLVEDILSLDKRLKELDETITKLFEAHKMKDVFASVPGAGTRLAPRLLSEFGENKNVFRSGLSAQCYAGTAPITRQSGGYRAVSMRRACRKQFRRTMQLLAFSSLKQSPWAREFYDQKRRAGQSHQAALRALANKWVKIIHRMWVDEVAYNESVFTEKRKAALAKAG